MTARRKPILLLLSGILLPTCVAAMHVTLDTHKVPVGRLIANLEQEYRENMDSDVAVRLGRLHGIAYSWKADSVSVIEGISGPLEGRELFFPGLYEPAVVHGSVIPAKDDTSRARAEKHLDWAIYWYQTALDQGRDDRRTRLGYGWCLMEADHKDEAKDVFRGIIAEAFGVEGEREARIRGGKAVTAEALKYLIELLNPIMDFSEKREREVQLKVVEESWGEPITPIVVSLHDGLSIDDIVRDDHLVTFNFDYGSCERWTWIDPRAGWLVHDFLDIGDIVSGRDLIGSVAFGVFWDDGYQVLRALDDNRDGVLREGELVGLKIWRDANMNGACDSGELMTLDELGIVGLSCACMPVGCNGRSMWQSAGGVFMSDGSRRNTYDVMLQPVEPIVSSMR